MSLKIILTDFVWQKNCSLTVSVLIDFKISLQHSNHVGPDWVKCYKEVKSHPF